MQIKKSELKQLIKECVREVLKEGFTRIMEQQRDFTDSEWSKIMSFCKNVFDEAEERNIKICGSRGKGNPIITNKLIAFNGSDKQGQGEAFKLVKNKKDAEFGTDFIKTNRKAYDWAVEKILKGIKKIAPNALKL